MIELASCCSSSLSRPVAIFCALYNFGRAQIIWKEGAKVSDLNSARPWHPFQLPNRFEILHKERELYTAVLCAKFQYDLLWHRPYFFPGHLRVDKTAVHVLASFQRMFQKRQEYGEVVRFITMYAVVKNSMHCSQLFFRSILAWLHTYIFSVN